MNEGLVEAAHQAVYAINAYSVNGIWEDCLCFSLQITFRSLHGC